MAAPIPLRADVGGDDLRAYAKRTRDATQARRLVALAAIYDGGSRGDAARIGGVGLQIVRDWVLRFNAAGPDGLIDRKAPGAEPRLNDDQRRALVAMVEQGPIPAVHGIVRWRLADLAQWVWEAFRIATSKQPISSSRIIFAAAAIVLVGSIEATCVFMICLTIISFSLLGSLT